MGCSTKSVSLEPIGDYKSLTTFTQNGTDITKASANKLDGKKVKFWGYIDKDGTSTCGFKNWVIAIKATKNSNSSSAININTPAEYSFSEVYHKIFDNKDNCLDKPVLVMGTLKTFPLSNFSTLVGIEVNVNNPNDIEFR